MPTVVVVTRSTAGITLQLQSNSTAVITQGKKKLAEKFLGLTLVTPALRLTSYATVVHNDSRVDQNPWSGQNCRFKEGGRLF